MRCSLLQSGIRFAWVIVVLAACAGPPDSARGFQWQVELSELDDALLSVCADGERVIAVGGRPGAARVLEWTGDAWYAPELPDGADVLWWCWIGSDGEALAVGERATVLRRDAAGTWAWEPTGLAFPAGVTLYGVWGAAPDDVWAVGGSPTGAGPSALAHYDGERWRDALAGEPERSGVLYKVWGAAPDDVWVVGAGGTILHYDGATWSDGGSPTTEQLIAVWGRAADDVYAVGGLGDGLVLRWDGAAWSVFAETAESLAGVWTAPGEPLYVGGLRGFLARFRIDSAGRTSALPDVAVVTDVCVHALTRADDDTLVATGADLFGGAGSGRRGALLTHGGSLAGAVVEPPRPDAGAGLADAGPTPDAAPADASMAPGKGDVCGSPPDVCAPGLECWLLQTSTEVICTQQCDDVTDCAGYDDPCCKIPGFQTTITVCIPGEYAECSL